jgi:hypothetical protein
MGWVGRGGGGEGEGLGRERCRGDIGFPPPLTKLQDSITVSKFANFLLIAKVPGQCTMCIVQPFATSFM